MTKPEVLKQKATEGHQALIAWKDAIKEEFKAGGTADESTWRATQKSKVDKCRLDFVALDEQVRTLKAEVEQEEQLSKFEKEYETVVSRLPVHGNGGNGANGTTPAERQSDNLGPMELLAHRVAHIERTSNRLWCQPLNRFVTPSEVQSHREALVKYIKSDNKHEAFQLLKGFGPQEVQLLSGVTGDLGGFTVPEDFRRELVRARPGFAVFRAAGARAMPCAGDVLVMPRVRSGTDPYSSGVSGSWRASGYVSGGTAPATQNQPKFNQERVQIFWWQPDVIELDPNLLADSAVNLEAVIGEELGRTKGLDEDSVFINGSGSGQPQGLLNAGVATFNTGTSTITYNTLTGLMTNLPAQYRAGAAFIFNSITLQKLLILETSAGVTLIFPQMANLQNNTVMSKPFHVSEFMPSITTSAAKAIIFGDFFYYVIGERQALGIMRLVERFAPNIGIMATGRIGGQPVLLDAFRIGVASA